jgi:hypothetical protein
MYDPIYHMGALQVERELALQTRDTGARPVDARREDAPRWRGTTAPALWRRLGDALARAGRAIGGRADRRAAA